ncbi:MAG: DNA mismatch repair protein MutS, partial [Myxococcota bacterium]
MAATGTKTQTKNKGKTRTKGGTRTKAKNKETLIDQYLRIKRDHPQGILFCQCGDFFEMFFEDAERAAELLDIALTSRNKHAEKKVPMAGVPHHSARGYIARLTELGEKVVVCEQVEDARLVKSGQVVKRAVVRVVTPGVVVDDEALDPRRARYLAALAAGQGGHFGLAYLDATTGEFRATEVAGRDALYGELARVAPHEILASAAELSGPLSDLAEHCPGAVPGAIEPHSADAARALLESALAQSVDALELTGRPLATRAAADAIAYARATQPVGNLPISRLQVYDPASTVVLDEAAVANLELVETLIGGRKDGSLLNALDHTRTAQGGRLLRRWLLYPLAAIAPIRRRQDAIAYLIEHASLRRDLRDALKRVHDLERLAGRIALGVVSPRDLGRLRDSLAVLPELVELIDRCAAEDRLAEVPALLRFDPANRPTAEKALHHVFLGPMRAELAT